MIFLELFLTFLKIGLISFGGGYGMIPLIREDVLSSGWLTEEHFLDLVAVSESTPGPIAVNMATFVGSSQGGFLGALAATLGVVLPSFIIILIIASLARTLLKRPVVQASLLGVRPVIVGLVLATGFLMLLTTLGSVTSFGDALVLDVRAIGIFIVLLLVRFLTSRFTRKKLSPFLLIVTAAFLGILFYGIMGA